MRIKGIKTEPEGEEETCLEVSSRGERLVAAVELAFEGDCAVVRLQVRPEVSPLGKALAAMLMLTLKWSFFGVTSFVCLELE